MGLSEVKHKHRFPIDRCIAWYEKTFSPRPGVGKGGGPTVPALASQFFGRRGGRRPLTRKKGQECGELSTVAKGQRSLRIFLDGVPGVTTGKWRSQIIRRAADYPAALFR